MSADMTLASVLDFALAYAQAGYSVLPVHGKIPLTENGSHDATTDPVMIARWWTKYPDANIGMTLDNLVAVDIDPRNGGDVDSLPHKLPDTCFQKTGGGGWHYLYRAHNGAMYPGSLGAGIDLKHGAGSYIVVEPSIHASGEKYGWLDESEPWGIKPTEAPGWLAKSDIPKAETREHSGPVDLLENIAAGTALHDSTCALAARYVGLGLTFGEICKLLEQALLASKTPHDERWRARFGDIPKLVNSAIEKFRSPQAVGHLLEHAFWVRDAKVNLELPYVVKGLFGRGQIIVCWGPPGSGKTFVVMEMVGAVGSGQKWRGRRTRHAVVIYVLAESSRAYAENRIAALKRECPAMAYAKVLFIPLALDLLHAGHGDVDRVIETAKHLAQEHGEVALVVVDTLAVTFGGGDENKSEDMGAYVTNIKRIVTETGAAVLVVHHCGKDEARGMRGHSALLGALDAEVAIEMASDAHRILRTGKVRDGDAYSDIFAFKLRRVELGTDPDGDQVSTCVVESLDEVGTKRVRRRKGAALGKHQKAVLRVLEAAGGRMPRLDLACKLKDDGMPRQRVSDAIGGLLEIGLLIAHNEVQPPSISLQ